MNKKEEIEKFEKEYLESLNDDFQRMLDTFDDDNETFQDDFNDAIKKAIKENDESELDDLVFNMRESEHNCDPDYNSILGERLLIELKHR